MTMKKLMTGERDWISKQEIARDSRNRRYFFRFKYDDGSTRTFLLTSYNQGYIWRGVFGIYGHVFRDGNNYNHITHAIDGVMQADTTVEIRAFEKNNEKVIGQFIIDGTGGLRVVDKAPDDKITLAEVLESPDDYQCLKLMNNSPLALRCWRDTQCYQWIGLCNSLNTVTTNKQSLHLKEMLTLTHDEITIIPANDLPSLIEWLQWCEERKAGDV